MWRRYAEDDQSGEILSQVQKRKIKKREVVFEEDWMN